MGSPLLSSSHIHDTAIDSGSHKSDSDDSSSDESEEDENKVDDNKDVAETSGSEARALPQNVSMVVIDGTKVVYSHGQVYKTNVSMKFQRVAVNETGYAIWNEKVKRHSLITNTEDIKFLDKKIQFLGDDFDKLSYLFYVVSI
jgi:hypothetical protein